MRKYRLVAVREDKTVCFVVFHCNFMFIEDDERHRFHRDGAAWSDKLKRLREFRPPDSSARKFASFVGLLLGQDIETGVFGVQLVARAQLTIWYNKALDNQWRQTLMNAFMDVYGITLQKTSDGFVGRSSQFEGGEEIPSGMFHAQDMGE